MYQAFHPILDTAVFSAATTSKNEPIFSFPQLFFVTLPLALFMVISQESEPYVDLILIKTVLLEYRHGKYKGSVPVRPLFQHMLPVFC